MVELNLLDNLLECLLRSQECVARKCDYLFGVDSDAHLENAEVLYQLIEQNRTVIAPMLHLAGNNSVINFWGSVRPDGTHDPTIDYLDVVLNHHRLTLQNVNSFIHIKEAAWKDASVANF